MMNIEEQSVLLDINRVKAATGFRSTTSIYTLMQSQGFPKPVGIGNRTKRWVESEVQGWIKKQIAQSRAQA